MNQFIFQRSYKLVLFGAMGLGLLSMILTLFQDDALYTRFWSNFLHNSVFFTGVAVMSLFFYSACVTAWAGWHTVIKRIWEAYALFLVVGLSLMGVVILGLWLGWHHLYHWADAEEVSKDVIMKGKSSFLNPVWYTLGTVIIVGIWLYFAWRMRQLSLDEDVNGTQDFKHHHRMRVWAAAFLPIGGFTTAAMIWQWVMSVDAHWYSTLFAWYSGASWFVAAIALTILLVSFLKSAGYLEYVTVEHLHDLGKYLFAFSVFWTYLWFSQYMLIWYANIGEETVYFQERMNNYPVLFYGNLVLNFIAPFFILMRNDTKRKYGTLVFTSIIVFIGHWYDYFQMLKPGVLHTAQERLGHHGGTGGAEHIASENAADMAHHSSAFMMGFHFPGLLEFGTLIGFLGLFFYFVFSQLQKASFDPVNDPYWEESLVHEASAVKPTNE